MRRAQVLDTARQYVTNDRQNDHGKPEDTFGAIADLWNAYLENGRSQPLYASDVAVMMILLKVARAQQNPQHDDNWVDIAGYAACAAELSGVNDLISKAEISDVE